MLVWQTFPPVLKFASGYSLVMDTAGVSIGGIHTGQLEQHTLGHTHIHTHHRWSKLHHNIHNSRSSTQKSITFTVRSLLRLTTNLLNGTHFFPSAEVMCLTQLPYCFAYVSCKHIQLCPYIFRQRHSFTIFALYTNTVDLK